MAGKAHKHLNLFNKPLLPFSTTPMTGFYRTGSCQVGPEDKGNHSIAATLTDPFLDFTASRGNDLRGAGLKAGCKWCICAGRFLEAVEFAKERGEESVVPRVNLSATNLKALDVVKMEDLKKYAQEEEVGRDTPQSRKGGLGGAIQEGTELTGKGSMTGRK